VPERDPAVERLVRLAKRSDVFVFCPITGDPYPTERQLIQQFRGLNYRCVGAGSDVNPVPGAHILKMAWRP
jgi:hypothetical protein